MGIARRLIRARRMKAAGLAEIKKAEADGRWGAAYDSPANSKAPADFLRRLAKDKAAKAFYSGLNKANLFTIHYRLQTAVKPETRERRMAMILGMLSKGKKFH